MTEPSPAERLAERLKELRLHRFGAALTQAQVAGALRASVPLVSAWENANAVPPEERLKAYALLFATARPFPSGAGQLPDESNLSEQEESARRRLIDELIALRDRAIRPTGPVPRHTGALGGRFWYFPDGAPVRIITTKMWPSVLDKIPYADRRHPNYIESYTDADRDATIELFGHIRAENPTADVRFLTADEARHEDLLGHVVVLGQGDQLWVQAEKHPESEYEPTVLEYLARRLELPLGTRVAPDRDRDFDGEFVVTLNENGEPCWYPQGSAVPDLEIFKPRWLRDLTVDGRPRLMVDGMPVLEYDVGLLARQPNQLNLATTVTVCSGVFSRGTYGAVRALTDAKLRTRNEHYLVDHFGALDNFWLLFYVPVFRSATGLETVTPDLERPFHRLRSSA